MAPFQYPNGLDVSKWICRHAHMSANVNTNGAVPKFASQAERRQWVLFQLRLRRESFASVAAELGVTRNSVSQALDLPSDRVEKALAAKLGVSPRALFPERYDAKGRRLHLVRGAAPRRDAA